MGGLTPVKTPRKNPITNKKGFDTTGVRQPTHPKKLGQAIKHPRSEGRTISLKTHIKVRPQIPKASQDLQGSMGKFPMETLEKTSGLRVGRRKKAFLDGHLGSHVPDVGRGGFKLVGEWADMILPQPNKYEVVGQKTTGQHISY